MTHRPAIAVAAAVSTAALLIAGCGSSPATAPTATPPPHDAGVVPPRATPTDPNRTAYAALGASETYGVGANPTANGYAYLVRDALHLPSSRFADVGVPSVTLADGYQNELTNALSIQPTLATVFFGVNDVRNGVPVAQFAADLTDLVSTLRRAGTRVLIIGMPDLTLVPAVVAQHIPNLAAVAPTWNAAMRQVAATTGASFLALDAYTAEVASHPQDVAADGLHPSNAGHARLAQLVLATLQQDHLIP